MNESRETFQDILVDAEEAKSLTLIHRLRVVMELRDEAEDELEEMVDKINDREDFIRFVFKTLDAAEDTTFPKGGIDTVLNKIVDKYGDWATG